jgi:hypothetical protein
MNSVKQKTSFVDRLRNIYGASDKGIYRDVSVMFKLKANKLEYLMEVADAIRFWSDRIVEVSKDPNNDNEIIKNINKSRIAKYKRIVNILTIKFNRLSSQL